jgi:hypothetical protein
MTSPALRRIALVLAAGAAISACGAGVRSGGGGTPHPLPDTPAGQRTRELLAAVNAGDTASLLRLADDSVIEARPHQLEAWLRGTATGAWTSIRLGTDSVAPYGITRLGMSRGIAPP